MRHVVSPKSVAAGILGLSLAILPMADVASAQAPEAAGREPGRRRGVTTASTMAGWACSGSWASPDCCVGTVTVARAT